MSKNHQIISLGHPSWSLDDWKRRVRSPSCLMLDLSMPDCTTDGGIRWWIVGAFELVPLGILVLISGIRLGSGTASSPGMFYHFSRWLHVSLSVCLNSYLNSHHSKGGKKFTTQISPQLNNKVI